MTDRLVRVEHGHRRLRTAMVFKCECCESAAFYHPADDPNCKSVNGQCDLLRRAGWRPAWVRIVLQAPEGCQDQPILSRGAWMCPECIGRFAKPEEWLR
jgi:hypothetical protein